MRRLGYTSLLVGTLSPHFVPLPYLALHLTIDLSCPNPNRQQNLRLVTVGLVEHISIDPISVKPAVLGEVPIHPVFDGHAAFG